MKEDGNDAPREGSSESNPRDQDDVLRNKDRTTSSAIGLQQWDEDEDANATGTASSGTAERAAKIAAGQKKQDDAREAER